VASRKERKTPGRVVGPIADECMLIYNGPLIIIMHYLYHHVIISSHSMIT
jgi:hypothetical protein